MKVALINPPWTFEGSIYFGCREPHLPLELGYCRSALERDGHEVLLLDGHLMGQSYADLAREIHAFVPAMTIVTTAPSYLFWRCAPPELRVPREMLDALGTTAGLTVAVGPHGSSTPFTTLQKLGAGVVVMGECEDVVAALANGGTPGIVPGTAILNDGRLVQAGGPQAASFIAQEALRWPDAWIARHHHHHHRFDRSPTGPGAEVEASRGCPYTCSFCAKIDFRDKYRRRDLVAVLAEIDGLIAQGAEYLYFIDEIFLPNRPLLEALVDRPIQFGIQTRIDLWKPDLIELLGRAGCVSIEAGVESLTEDGRAALDKRCKLSTDELAALLILARQHVPFVQANLLEVADDDPAMVTAWRDGLKARGVWANDPVPLYPYPSSPDYRKLFGLPDDAAWERAHQHYLGQFTTFSDIQD
ncbi:MAG: TIGR04295 family B12-binding domain-containing radical SAM protein, partial [Pseudomonadota bacterium]|nr:TIGR04295 family B12-binding domain-containing radical SAM protein [Pseudomonadota bacterium]